MLHIQVVIFTLSLSRLTFTYAYSSSSSHLAYELFIAVNSCTFIMVVPFLLLIPMWFSQAHESLQAMGSSADSCDSETTVTSYSEELRTPRAEQSYFNELDEDRFLHLEMASQEGEAVSEAKIKIGLEIMDGKSGQSEGVEGKVLGQGDFVRLRSVVSTQQGEFEVLEEDSEESDLDKSSECEFTQYKTHHILKSASSIESTSSAPSSVERVTTALQRAQKRISGSPDSRAGRALLKSKDLLFKQRHRITDLGYPLRRSQSLPTTLLNPVRIVSSVNVQLGPGKQTLCGPPSFTYKYDMPEEDGKEAKEEEKPVTEAPNSPPRCKSTLFIAPSVRKETFQPSVNKVVDEPCRGRIQSCPLHLPQHLSQSTCSLHSLHSDCFDRSLCAHMRTFSTQSIPSTPGSSCSGLPSPFGCPYSLRSIGHPQQPHSMNSPSTVEMQLRRVLHDIRSSLQNLSQVRENWVHCCCDCMSMSCRFLSMQRRKIVSSSPVYSSSSLFQVQVYLNRITPNMKAT